MAIEKDEWQTHYMAKQESDIRQREKAFKEKLVKERDAEIEMIVQRLESETSCNSSEATRRYRMELEKIKAETAEEVKQLRDQHSLALDKFLTCQSQLRSSQDTARELEKQVLQIQHELSSKENLIKQQKSELSRLKVDEQTLSTAIRQDFESELAAKAATIGALAAQCENHQQELDTLRQQQRCEAERISQEKDETIRLIEVSVRKALTTKEQVVSGLKSQVEELGIKNSHLERLIEKQRQELLG
ncbi:hypothetical protein DFS34DRAFT_360468 [Phlyctochytrium arcticum]|nr:hypothetical protein DFS34DRAFT_360468 [Phlyctochytrium arcticum]